MRGLLNYAAASRSGRYAQRMQPPSQAQFHHLFFAETRWMPQVL